jgi:hypothetical protein
MASKKKLITYDFKQYLIAIKYNEQLTCSILPNGQTFYYDCYGNKTQPKSERIDDYAIVNKQRILNHTQF